MGRWITESGAELTESDAQRLADEAERGYDLPGPGRPSLTGDPVESPQVTFRLSPDLRAAAQRRAASEGKTLSELAREALERYLAG